MSVKVGEGFRRLAAPFRTFAKAWQAYLAVLLAGLVLMAVQTAFPDPVCLVGYPIPATICYLGSSISTPWGVVTAIVVHSSWEHYAGNIMLLFALTLVFTITNAPLETREKTARRRLFIALMFLAGIAANVASLVVNPNGLSRGSSGMAYGVWGVTSAFCVANVVPRVSRFDEIGTYYKNPQNLVWSLGNLLAAVALLGGAILTPALFLAVGPGVNVLAHFVGFVFAFAGTGVWFLAFDSQTRS